MTVRPATAADAETIADVQQRTWLATYSDYVDPELILEQADRREDQWREILREGAFTLVAEAGGRLGGFASWGLSRDADAHPAHPPIGELYALYVAPEAQGAGVGTALQDAVLRDLAEAGFGLVTLWVFERNAAARAFYERSGWTVDTRPFDPSRWDWAPSVRYRRDLAPGGSA